jgi:hypothetical protein
MSLNAEPVDADGEALRFERLVADLCARFVNVSPESVDAAIVDSQRQIVESLDLDRSALFEIADTGELRLTHDWTRPEFGARIENLSATRSFPWYSEQIGAGRTVVVQDSREVPSETDRQALERVGTMSTVVIPLGGGGVGLGALTFATRRAPRQTCSASSRRRSKAGWRNSGSSGREGRAARMVRHGPLISTREAR